MKLAVVGNPIAHSKSPLIFQFLFEALKMNGSYVRILLNSANEIPPLFENGIVGINITAPFKQSVLPYLSEISNDARQIASVNTVISKEGKLHGFNTDYLGVINALEEKGIDLASKRCLILGGGGAARAAIYGLRKRGAIVQVYNRTENKASDLAKEFNVNFLRKDDLKKAIQNTDTLIDTLPLGVKIIPSEYLHANLTILDASYPKSVYDGSNIAHLIGGEHWLLHQALPAFELFTGIKLNTKEYNQKALLDLLI